MRIVCIPRNFPLVKSEDKVAWNENWATQQGPQEEAQREARSPYSKSVWTHQDADLCEASEKVGALYHRWSAAAEDSILKTSEAGNTRSCVGRGAVLITRTASILPHVAKREPCGSRRGQNLGRPRQQDSNSRWLTAHWHGERTLPDDGQSAQNCLCTKAA